MRRSIYKREKNEQIQRRRRLWKDLVCVSECLLSHINNDWPAKYKESKNLNGFKVSVTAAGRNGAFISHLPFIHPHPHPSVQGSLSRAKLSPRVPTSQRTRTSSHKHMLCRPNLVGQIQQQIIQMLRGFDVKEDMKRDAKMQKQKRNWKALETTKKRKRRREEGREGGKSLKHFELLGWRTYLSKASRKNPCRRKMKFFRLTHARGENSSTFRIFRQFF